MMTDTEVPQTEISLEAVDTASVLRCYVVLAFGMGFAMSPYPPLGGAAILALLVGTIWAYRIRKRESANGIFKNHGTWMVRTFWIASLYTLIAMILSGSIISANADPASLAALQDTFKTAQGNGLLIKMAVDKFDETNRSLLTISTLICFVPVLFFVLARFFLGYRKADKGQLMPNIKTWLIV